MASSTMIVTLPLVVFSLLLPTAFGGVICEDLPEDLCTFSVSSSGRRCTLESTTGAGSPEYHCSTSEIVVSNMADWIENDECVRACGVNRSISSDALLEENFREKLCSDACYRKCPNIVDLYSNLASSEGMLLSAMCNSLRSSTDRVMLEVDVSAGVGSGPATAPAADADGPSPS